MTSIMIMAKKETSLQKTDSTVVSEVSSFIGKPVYPSLGAFAP